MSALIENVSSLTSSQLQHLASLDPEDRKVALTAYLRRSAQYPRVNWRHEQIGLGVQRCPMSACTSHNGWHGDIYDFPERRLAR